MAVLRGVGYFWQFLAGSHFCLFTDYSASTGLSSKRNLSPRLHRWALLSVQIHVGDDDLPAVTVSYFFINHVESRVGVFTPHFGRQTHYFHSPFYMSFDTQYETRLSSVRLSSLLYVRQ